MTGPGAGRRPSGRLAVLLAAGAVPLVLLPGLVVPPAAAGESCVGVIVDARLLGGAVSTGCAKGDPDSGLDALAAAGFRYAFAPRVPGFVCQIDAAPECSRTGTTTYWSYWYRSKDSAPWVYSSAGAGSRDPAPGSMEAWVWQDGGRREPPDVPLATIRPPGATARTERAVPSPSPSPSPARTLRPAAAAHPSGRTTGTPQRPPPAASSAAAASPAPTSLARTGTAETSTPPAPAPSTGPSAGSSRAGSPAAGDEPDGSPWTGVVLGGGLVAALGAAALARARRAGGSR